jgi:hypothetical protein
MVAFTKYIQPIAAESSLFAIWVRFRQLQDKRRYYSRSLRSAQSRTASGIYDKRVPSFVVAAGDS